MKTTKKEINEATKVRKGNGFQPSFGFYFQIDAKNNSKHGYKFSKSFLNERIEIESFDGSIQETRFCNTKKEFVNAVYDYLKSL